MKKIQSLIFFCLTIMSVHSFGQCPSHAGFNYSFPFGTNSSKVEFINTSYEDSNSIGHIIYSWDFKDSNYSSQKNPVHYFDNPGYYLVTLTLYDSLNNCISQDSTQIHIVASCRAQIIHSISGDSAVFTSTGSSYDYTWLFSDSSTYTSRTFTKVFSKVGTYHVLLEILDSLSFCYDSTSLVFEIKGDCKAGFTYNITNDTVNFNSTALNSNYISWDFGDGTFSGNTNPTHIYDSSGTYIICQTVQDSLSMCSNTFCDTILVIVPDPCMAGYTYTSKGDTVHFSNTALNYTTVNWDFGDGTQSNNSNPIHIYDSSATYLVCQSVHDSLRQCTDVFCDSIQVIVPCRAAYTYVVKDDTVNFSSSASNYTTISWDFGDGVISNVSDPSHIYNSSGIYFVCQTVSDSLHQCTDVFCDTIEVSILPKCFPSYTYSISGSSLTFQNTSNNFNADFQWDFGDGSTSNSLHPVHTYIYSDSFIVSLSMLDSSNGNSCQNVFVDTIPVSVPCNAHYTVAIDSNQSFKIYLVNNSSNFSTHNYQWDFGDGSSATGRTPSHQYLDYGSYNVCLSITDSVLNCISNFCNDLGMDSNGVLLRGAGFFLEVIDESSIGIEDISLLEKISIYPNPVSDHLQIDLVGINSELKISLLDVSGKILETRKTKGIPKAEFDMGLYGKGIYLLKISDQQNYIVRKLIKF